ncbi:hypothetical protein ACHAXS_012949 [Conticribra weissflogii]
MAWKLQVNDNQFFSLVNQHTNVQDNELKKSLLDFVRRSSCPPRDDFRRLLPWRVHFTTSQDERDHDDGASNSGIDTNSRQFYVHIPPNLCSSLLESQTRQNLQPQQRSQDEQLPSAEAPSSIQRVILAIHGYGGRPFQELQKWHEIVVRDETVIIAPQGTPTQTPNGNQKLGWNAKECCGDPVLNDLDDVEFVLRGVVEVFSGVLDNILDSGTARDEKITNEKGDGSLRKRNGNIQVIATGFSNGGFFTSLLGLLPSQSRPEWLVGIVPTGGYQYDIGLYNGQYNYEDESRDVGDRLPDPLPILMHHGGRDSVVKPEGCCNVDYELDRNSGVEQSNCVFDIGIHQPTCTSVQNAFEQWVEINQCESGFRSVFDDIPSNFSGVDVVDMMIEKKDAIRNENNDSVDPQYEPTNPSKVQGGNGTRLSTKKSASNIENSNSYNQLTCQKGNRCRAPTGFCLWKNEGHSWGGTFPGMEMTRIWMDRVFDEAEHAQGMTYSDNTSVKTNSSNIMGRAIFSEFVLLLTFLAAVSVVASMSFTHGIGIKRRSCCKICCRRGKRKSSEEFVLDGDDAEATEVERGSILEAN